MQVCGKISPIWAPICSLIEIRDMEKPVKPSFSFPVENALNYRSVCQNKADLHLAQCLPMALQSRLFSPPVITRLNLETLPEHQCEGHFFFEGN
jgi:hypothetical protein